jgi:hypothetical protein
VRIDACYTEMEPSEWSELSESAGARTTVILAAAERIPSVEVQPSMLD